MPQQIDVPGVGIVEFPDGMSDDAIAAAIKSNMPAKEAAPPSAGLDTEDMAKSAGTGLAQGTIDTITTPQMPLMGSLENIRSGGTAIAKAAGANVPAWLDKPLPTMGELGQHAAEQFTGKFYEPKTPEGKYSQIAAALVPGLAVPSGSGAIAPGRAALKEASRAAYQSPVLKTLEMEPDFLRQGAEDITKKLTDAGYRDYLAPKTFRAVKELDALPGANTATMADTEGVRRALSKAAADPAEKDAARRATAALDEHMATLSAPDVVAGDAAAANKTIQEARANYAAGKRSESVGDAMAKAERQAESAGSGSNIDNATRQRFKAILNSPQKSRGFSPEELAQMERVVRGTAIGNIARLIGKAAPTGIVSGSLSGGAGFLAGGVPGAIALPILGSVGKRVADRSTLRQAEKLDEMIRARSPLSTVSPSATQQMNPQRAAMIAAILNGQYDASQR